MQNEMQKSNCRKCTVKCDRVTLTSLIASELRRRRIPMDLLGGDIIRGAVFDMMDHPEHSIADSVGRAVDYSKFPGTLSRDYEDEETKKEKDIAKGYNLIYEAVEASILKDIPWTESLEKKKEIVDVVLRSMASDCRRSYCYATMVHYFKTHPLKLDTLLGEELIKDMVFKKLVADESTKQCMYEYAFRKEFNTDNQHSYQEKKSKIFSTMRNYCKKVRKTPYQIACEIVDEIYESETKKTK